MGIMQAGREGGRQAEEGIQKPRRRRVRHSPPPLSLCEKALRISLACVHTRTAVAAARAHVCAISCMQCGLPGFPDGPLSSPLSPFSIQDLINAQIQFLWSFKAQRYRFPFSPMGEEPLKMEWISPVPFLLLFRCRDEGDAM